MIIDNIDNIGRSLARATTLAHCYDNLHDCLREFESMFPQLFVDGFYPHTKFKQPAMDMIQHAYSALDDIHYQLNDDMKDLERAQEVLNRFSR